MIKILHVLTDTNIGGAGHQAAALLEGCSRKKFSLEAAVPRGSKLVPLLQKKSIPFAEVDFIGDRSLSLRGIFALRKLIKSKRPSIVHTHASLSGRIAAKLCGKIKIVYTRHSIFAPKRGDDKFPRIQFARLACLLFADGIIAVTPQVKDDLVRTGARAEKIRVIPNGTHKVAERSAEEKAALRKKYDVPEGAFVAAVSARLSEVKGHDDALDAAKNLPGILFLFAGEGERRAHIERRVADENILNIKLLGFVEAIDEIENITDVQVSASFGTEAASLSLLRGMSLGIPTVASDFGGNPFVVENGINGLLYKTRDVPALTEALLRVKNDAALYDELSRGARMISNEKFSAEKMIEATEGFYIELERGSA